jgi:hypothetical protein
MTVATLFVGIAFQAVLQPPPGISFQHSSQKAFSGGASAPAPAPAPATTGDNARIYSHWSFLNSLTMILSLATLVLLMTMRNAASTDIILTARTLLFSTAIIVGTSFIIAVPEILSTELALLTGMVISITVVIIL